MKKPETTRLLAALGYVVMSTGAFISENVVHVRHKMEPTEPPMARRAQHTRGSHQIDENKLERMSNDQIKYALEQSPQTSLDVSDQERRILTDYAYYPTFDNSQYVDKWSQGYRMLGGYIDCDHNKNYQYTGKGQDKQQGGDNKGGQGQKRNLGGKNNGNDTGYGCSRWLMWASYYNPNYQGNAYYEYFSNSATSSLDCHKSDTEWQLIGVYRQELYQWYEQISKHLWAVDDYDYVVALAGLAYMTNADCAVVGKDSSGNPIYGGVAPQGQAYIQMQLYSDKYCISPLNSGSTYGNYVGTSSMKLHSQDGGNYYNLYDYWVDAQEYTLYNFNQVYEPYKSCTPCMDYPTYQDGFFIGDTGTDDGDLINQCWKFYSHDSYTCNGDCVALGAAQGSILSLNYNGYTFGYGNPVDMSTGYYSNSAKTVSAIQVFEVPFLQSEKFATLKANAFIGVASVLFLGTFLAFAVARGSARAIEKEDKAHVLLDDYYHDPSERKKRRSSGKSVSRNRSSRSMSKSKDSQHRSNYSTSRTRSGGVSSGDERSGRAKSSRRSISRAGSSRSMGSEDSEARRQRRRERRRERDRQGKYEAPDSSASERRNRRSKSRTRSASSRRVRDDF